MPGQEIGDWVLGCANDGYRCGYMHAFQMCVIHVKRNNKNGIISCQVHLNVGTNSTTLKAIISNDKEKNKRFFKGYTTLNTYVILGRATKLVIKL